MFLDSDCFLTPESLHYLEKNLGNRENAQPSELSYCLCGHYLNPENASYLQKVHNFIANTWLQHSYAVAGQLPMLLGGCFAIHLSSKLNIEEPRPLFWGAEDKVLALELYKKRVLLSYQPHISVTHRTNSDWSRWLRKAWLHGINEVKYCFDQNQPISGLFWIRKIGFSNLNLLPAVLTHFFVQRAAMLFQIVRQTSKKRRSEKNRESQH